MANHEPQRKSVAQLQAQCDAWNAQHDEGSLVSYESIIGEGETHRGETRSPAQVLSQHSAVVWLKGKQGCVLLDHCTVLVSIAPDLGDAQAQPEPMAQCVACEDVHPVESRKSVPDKDIEGMRVLVCLKCGYEDYTAVDAQEEAA